MRFFILNYLVSPLYFLPQIAYLRFKNSVLLFHCLKLGLVASRARNLLEQIGNPSHVVAPNVEIIGARSASDGLSG